MPNDDLWISRKLLESKAWYSLTGTSPQIYMEFLKRRKQKNHGTKKKPNWVTENKRDLIFPYREARDRFGLSFPRFTRAIDNLIEHGFIVIVKPGSGTSQIATIVRVKVGFCRDKT